MFPIYSRFCLLLPNSADNSKLAYSNFGLILYFLILKILNHEFFESTISFFIILSLILVGCDSNKMDTINEDLEIDQISSLIEDEEFRSVYYSQLEFTMLGQKNFISNTTFEDQAIIESEFLKIEDNTPVTNLEVFVDLFGMKDKETMMEEFSNLDDKWVNVVSRHPYIRACWEIIFRLKTLIF